MIAQELVDGKTLGADIVTPNKDVGENLRNLFASESLDIHLIIRNPKNTELYAALKNIIALILGYYEGQ
jgi:glycerol-3-phosphate dehydrogenase